MQAMSTTSRMLQIRCRHTPRCQNERDSNNTFTYSPATEDFLMPSPAGIRFNTVRLIIVFHDRQRVVESIFVCSFGQRVLDLRQIYRQRGLMSPSRDRYQRALQSWPSTLSHDLANDRSRHAALYGYLGQTAQTHTQTTEAERP